ncbi:MAG: DinB family protein [Saprospiraceae bacterium]
MRFLILLSFFLVPIIANAQFPLQQEWLEKWDNAQNYTLECLELMPEDRMTFRPTQDEMTFAEQLVHMSKNMCWLANKYLGKEPAYEYDWKTVPKTKDELEILVMEAYTYARQAVETIQESDLEKNHEFFAGPMTGRQIMNLMQDHQTHHRGQLIVYLRLNNLTPPKYRGW